ncbi:pilus assembly protein [Rhizobiaceae bacterium]|nr:pilus assembly protein [Rhizobiaceae bacterium]
MKPQDKPRGSLLRAFKRDEDGTAMVEFAFIMVPFFTVIFAIFELGVHFMAERMLISGVDTVARQVKVGTLRSSNSREDFENALCNEQTDGMLFLFDCKKLKFDVREITDFGDEIDPCDPDDPSAPCEFAPGARSTINMVRVNYEWPTIVNWEKWNTDMEQWIGGTVTLDATVMFRTEPY